MTFINFHKKGQGISINKLIAIIIVVLVLAAVLIFIFKFDILKYFKFLPDFSSPDDDEIIEIREEEVEFSRLEIESTDFSFGGGESGGAGAERPFDPDQYERLKTPIPDPLNFVSDYANVISSNTESELNAMLSSIEKTTSVEIAIVSMRSMEKGYKQVAEDVFNQWGIGKKDKDNGILIIFSLTDNTVRIEVGYGLEGVLPDGKVGELIDTRLGNNLNEQKIGGGLKNVINDIKIILEKE